MEYPVRNAQMNLIVQSSRPLFFKIHRSFLYNILLKAPLRSRLSMDTVHPGWACHAAWILKVTKERAKRVNYFFLTPIWVYSSSFCASAVSYMRSITIFSRSFSKVFSKAIGRQLPKREQSFFFAFCRITVVVILRYLGSSPF